MPSPPTPSPRATPADPAPARPPCLGLTGGIGAGKSAALRAFAACGASTLSSDEVVHRLYRQPEVIAAVVDRFGPQVLDARGAVDRAALGEHAFAQADGAAFLEGLIHPRVGAERTAWQAVQASQQAPPPLLVCEVPLLFEAGLEDVFDAVLVVTAPEDVRRRRAEARGQPFAARSGRQMGEAEKVARADRVYVNDGSVGGLRAWVAERFQEYSGRPCEGVG